MRNVLIIHLFEFAYNFFQWNLRLKQFSIRILQRTFCVFRKPCPRQTNRIQTAHTRRITITFDSGKEFDRQQIARLYRVARVVSHVATNGRVVIEADVPRRFIERLTTPSPQERARESL